MIDYSGIGTYLKNLLIYLVEKIDWIDWILLGNEEELLKTFQGRNDKIKIISLNAKIFSINEQFELIKKIPQDIDLLWIPNFNIPIFYHGKMLVTIHDVFHLAMSHLTGGYHKYLYAKFLFFMVKKRSHEVLCVSNFTKNEIVKFIGVKLEKIHPIYLGVSKEWCLPLVEKNCLYQKPYILFVGNLKPNKNLGVLIKACLLLKDDIDLVVVGKRDGFSNGDKSFKAECDKMKRRICFTGFVTDEELKNYYYHAQMFVFPSLYEGFGLPVLEAMACGCPVLLSNRASLPDVGGDAAIYFNPESEEDLAEKIEQIYNDGECRARMIKKGYENLKNFSWNECGVKTAEIIKKML